MRTSNPVLINTTFSGSKYIPVEETMTIQGVVWKTAVLLLVTMMTALWTWMKFVNANGDLNAISTWMTIGVVGGFILALATAFKPAWSSVTAPMYAFLEGLFIGGISAVMEQSYPGIVINAALLTGGTLAAMLAAYQSGFIRATESFKMGVFAATGGIALAYLITLVLGFFNIQVPMIYGNGMAGILFSLFVVIVAALNFILDFDFIEQGARKGAPKYMEWYGAFAMMVTLIWLYIEFLRLLAKLRSRD